MRILYLVDYYQPQIGYNEYYLPREWSLMGHEVTILTSNYYYPFPNYTSTAGKLLGSRRQQPGIFKQGDITVIKQPLDFEIFTRAIFRGHEAIIKKIKPDLVIVNKSSSFNSFLSARLKHKYNYKLLTYDAHLMSGYLAVGNVAFKNIVYWLYRIIIARYMNARVDKYIAVQEGTKDVMENLYGQKPVEHIPLGTDPSRFHFDRQSRDFIRTKLGIKKTDRVAIYTGKVIETKGVSILFAAFSKLAHTTPNLHLLIVGTGPDYYINSCLGLVDHEYHSRIHFVGFKPNEELYQYYSSADFGVWPLEESTSMNDAASCEIPFIANDQVGVELRFGNNNALKYKRGDSDDLAQKILYLANNYQEAKAMGKRGRALIIDSLSWQIIAKKYLTFIKTDIETSLTRTLAWLSQAQEVSCDGGVSAYHSLLTGWAPSFIETTGYIISSFIQASKHFGDIQYLQKAKKMGDFILSMQLPSGGFRTYTPEKVQGSEPTIFNTAQDILGLVDLYKATGIKKYLHAAESAAAFLLKTQNQDGTWTKYTQHSTPKTYHSRVAYALLAVYQISRKNSLKNGAIKQLDWVVSNQLSNGFVIKAQLPIAKYPDTITHTLAYVAEGLLYSGEILGSKRYMQAADKIITQVQQYYSKHHSLPSYFDSRWQPKEHFACLTGEAQFAILFLKYYDRTRDNNYLSSAYQLITRLEVLKSPSGGVSGSWPIYGDLFHNRGYCRLAYINWAAKFTVDAEMLFLSL